MTDTYSYHSTSNLLQGVTRSGVTPDPRAFTYDGAGNTLTDVRSGVSYAYTYNSFEPLATRVIANSGSANGTSCLRFGCPPASARMTPPRRSKSDRHGCSINLISP